MLEWRTGAWSPIKQRGLRAPGGRKSRFWCRQNMISTGRSVRKKKNKK
jgi:hypothetical protein